MTADYLVKKGEIKFAILLDICKYKNDKNFTCINAIFVVKYILLFGVWLSLVERFVRDEEAVGSNPVTPI